MLERRRSDAGRGARAAVGPSSYPGVIRGAAQQGRRGDRPRVAEQSLASTGSGCRTEAEAARAARMCSGVDEHALCGGHRDRGDPRRQPEGQPTAPTADVSRRRWRLSVRRTWSRPRRDPRALLHAIRPDRVQSHPSARRAALPRAAGHSGCRPRRRRAGEGVVMLARRVASGRNSAEAWIFAPRPWQLGRPSSTFRPTQANTISRRTTGRRSPRATRLSDAVRRMGVLYPEGKGGANDLPSHCSYRPSRRLDHVVTVKAAAGRDQPTRWSSTPADCTAFGRGALRRSAYDVHSWSRAHGSDRAQPASEHLVAAGAARAMRIPTSPGRRRGSGPGMFAGAARAPCSTLRSSRSRG